MFALYYPLVTFIMVQLDTTLLLWHLSATAEYWSADEKLRQSVFLLKYFDCFLHQEMKDLKELSKAGRKE